jgi:hypothetical protein
LNYIGQKVFSQPVSQIPSSEKEIPVNLGHEKVTKLRGP